MPNYRHAVYAGSFDPITLGHEAILERAAKLFDRVTVGIGVNNSKSGLFSAEERRALVESSARRWAHVEVATFSGLLVNFVQRIDAGVVIRGLRLVADFEHEFQLALANRQLGPEIETVFLMTESEQLHISSSLVKEIAKNGGNLTQFVSGEVSAALYQKFGVSPGA